MGERILLLPHFVPDYQDYASKIMMRIRFHLPFRPCAVWSSHGRSRSSRIEAHVFQHVNRHLIVRSSPGRERKTVI